MPIFERLQSLEFIRPQRRRSAAPPLVDGCQQARLVGSAVQAAAARMHRHREGFRSARLVFSFARVRYLAGSVAALVSRSVGSFPASAGRSP